MTQEQKSKISASKKGTRNTWSSAVLSKKVISIKDGVETVHDSLLAASKATGCERRTLSLVAEGVYKQTKGYVFKYA